MDTDRGHAASWPSTFTDRLGEARTFARTTGRRTVRRAVSVARARLHGSEGTLRWSRASLKAAYDVVVVGGDLGGLWLAFELSERAGLRVAVLEADLVGGRWPSRARVALSELAAPPGTADLVRRSAARLEQLATERGLPLAVGRTDVVTIARSEEELRSLAARVRTLPPAPGDRPGAELIGVEQASELLGHLDPRGVVGAALEAGAPVVDARHLPWILGGLAGGRGVDLVEHAALEGLEAGTGGWEVTTTAGVTSCGLVVDATSDAGPTLAAGLAHGCFWQRWETLLTEPVQPFLRAVVRTACGEVSQTDQGEVQLAGRAGAAHPQVDRFPVADAAALAADATELLPALARLRLVAHRRHLELVAPDGRPMAGPAGADGLLRLGGFGGQPLGLAPAVAEGLARLIQRRPPLLPLDSLAPARATVAADPSALRSGVGT